MATRLQFPNPLKKSAQKITGKRKPSEVLHSPIPQRDEEAEEYICEYDRDEGSPSRRDEALEELKKKPNS
jgi:hypothetical protein